MSKLNGINSSQLAIKITKEFFIDTSGEVVRNWEKGRSYPDIPQFLALIHLCEGDGELLADFGLDISELVANMRSRTIPKRQNYPQQPAPAADRQLRFTASDVTARRKRLRPIEP